MEEQPLVALVVPVHNNWEDTREFLESTKQLSYPEYKTIVIDDGSTDNTYEMIKEQYPDVILLKGDGNLWWSGAINMGFNKAIEIGAKYTLMIDNDTVPAPELISELVATAEKNPRSMIVPKVYTYNQPKIIEKACYGTNWWRRYYIGQGELDQGQYDKQQIVPWADTMMLINTSFFKDLGMMDAENLPLYGADLDFSLRAHKKGYHIIYEPKGVIWHKRHRTATQGTENTTTLRSRIQYYTNNLKSPVRWHTHKTIIVRHSPKYLILPKLMISLMALIIRIVKNDKSI